MSNDRPLPTLEQLKIAVAKYHAVLDRYEEAKFIYRGCEKRELVFLDAGRPIPPDLQAEAKRAFDNIDAWHFNLQEAFRRVGNIAIDIKFD